MKLPVISELRAKGGRAEAVSYIVSYIKQLVNALQNEIDKRQSITETVCVTDIRVANGKIIVSYSNENEKVFEL